MNRLILLPALVLFVTACSTAPAQKPGSGHLSAEKVGAGQDNVAASIPAPVQQILALPKPKVAPKVETYSVVVNNVRVQELLFALARDAKLNVDIHPGIEGVVTLNAIDQTLQQLLTRITKQVDVRWELDGPNLAVMPDSPFLRTYKVDYVNMSRDTSGTVTVTTQIASTGAAAGGAGGAGIGGGGGNNSLTKIDNKAQNRFWETLEKNLKDLLRETDKVLPEGSSETVVERQDEQATTGTGVPPAPTGRGAAATGLAASPNPASMQLSGTTVTRRTTFREAASVIINAESGIVMVRATTRQQEKVQEFLDHVLASVKRQVLIEATIAEVTLSNNYQQGIDWARLPLGSTGFTLRQRAVGALSAPAAALMELTYTNPTSRFGNIDGTIKLLEGFGTVKVLSSPKLSVLNNQTAVLKVVDNQVYFTIKADTTTNQTASTTTYTTTLHSVPVGFVMNVTPQISESNTVLLNLRPSVSRIVEYVADPNPSLKKSSSNNFDTDIVSRIPVIRTREMESIIRIENGNIAVMGGLMEDSQKDNDTAVPGAYKLPFFGNLFQHRDDTRTKTELVVFLRPVVIKDASVQGDFSQYRDQLPDQDFFSKNQIAPPLQVLDFGSPAR
ncbi:MAG: secretin N-terminal domain-containing protein [Rhodocyclaceae bacterium]|nr:secretin N-terminal domain-containing protein [Rhodocyclaceae bacterium]